MQIHRQTFFLIAVASVALSVGCGGGGGGSNTGTTGSGGGTNSSPNVPNAQTSADVANNLTAYSQSVVSNCFFSFGPKLNSHGTPFLIPTLGLYGVVLVGPEGFAEHLYTDSGATNPAGSFVYAQTDQPPTQKGPISILDGYYAGLTGNFIEKVSLSPAGYNGTIEYSTPNLATVNNIYKITFGSNGATSGTAIVSINLQNSYTQIENVTYNLDGSISISATDSSKLTSKFNFASDLSCNGTISGADHGLKALVSLDPTGTGTITYANGSTVPIMDWKLSS